MIKNNFWYFYLLIISGLACGFIINELEKKSSQNNIKNESVKGLFKGNIINILRVAPAFILKFEFSHVLATAAKSSSIILSQINFKVGRGYIKANKITPA